MDNKEIKAFVGFDGVTTHYCGKSGLQVDDVIEDFDLNFRLGNAVKYILRYGKKGTKEDAKKDLKKAIAYIEKELKHSEAMEGCYGDKQRQ